MSSDVRRTTIEDRPLINRMAGAMSAYLRGDVGDEVFSPLLNEWDEYDRTRPLETARSADVKAKIVHGVNCDCRTKISCEDAEEAELHGTVRGKPITSPSPDPCGRNCCDRCEGRELMPLNDGAAPATTGDADYDAIAEKMQVPPIKAQLERAVSGWKRECDDTDSLLRGIGLTPEQYRSEGGSLLVEKTINTLKAPAATGASDGVHAAHCCAKHGCKYGESNCPVVAGKVAGYDGCESCADDEPATTGARAREFYMNFHHLDEMIEAGEPCKRAMIYRTDLPHNGDGDYRIFREVALPVETGAREAVGFIDGVFTLRAFVNSALVEEIENRVKDGRMTGYPEFTAPPEVTHGAAIGVDVVTDADVEVVRAAYELHTANFIRPSALRIALEAFLRARATASTRQGGGDVGRDAK